MVDMNRRRLCIAVAGAAWLTLTCPGVSTARGEFVLSVYGGAAFTEDTDLDLKLPGGTDMTFHDTSYKDKSFEMPPYYGLRLTYGCDDAPRWGGSFDFIHAKAYLEDGDTVGVSGRRGGAKVSGQARISDTHERFNMSHGLNFFMFNLMHRFFLAPQRDKTLLGRLQPCLGVGGGFAVPHVEATAGGRKTDEYQFGGPAFQALAGLNIDLVEHWSVFFEYKFTYADVDMDLDGGGSIHVEPMMHHFVFGVSLTF